MLSNPLRVTAATRRRVFLSIFIYDPPHPATNVVKKKKKKKKEKKGKKGRTVSVNVPPAAGFMGDYQHPSSRSRVDERRPGAREGKHSFVFVPGIPKLLGQNLTLTSGCAVCQGNVVEALVG